MVRELSYFYKNLYHVLFFAEPTRKMPSPRPAAGKAVSCIVRMFRGQPMTFLAVAATFSAVKPYSWNSSL